LSPKRGQSNSEIDCKNAIYTSPPGEKAAISGGGIDGKNAAYLLLGKISLLKISIHKEKPT
jgi:hypothetical protein